MESHNPVHSPEAKMVSPITEAAWAARRDKIALNSCAHDTEQARRAQLAVNVSFANLFDKSLPFLTASYRRIYRGTPQDESDIMQETYLRVYKNLEHFRGDSKIETWMYTIMTNRAKTHFSKKNKHMNTDDIDAIYADNIHAIPEELRVYDDEAQFMVEMRDKVVHEINQLSPKLREVVLMNLRHGITHEEIARHLGITVTTAKVRLHRARARLQGIRHASNGTEDE